MPEPEEIEEATVEIVPGPFATACREACEQAWQASHEHPFVTALIDGSLDRQRFKFYQMQDARFLEGFSDVCAVLSTRFTDPGDKLWFIDGARLAIVVERELHENYGRQLGYTAEDIAALELTPNNRAYRNHMMTAAAHGSLLEGVAALTPCPWLYTDIGQRTVRRTGPIPDEHPYADWLSTYADPGFVEYTNDVLAFMERLAESHGKCWRERAVEAFSLSVRYEWMFWDQAWTQQQWPV